MPEEERPWYPTDDQEVQTDYDKDGGEDEAPNAQDP